MQELVLGVCHQKLQSMKYVKLECIYVDADCGINFLPRDVAREKLKYMVGGVKIVHKELEKEEALKVSSLETETPTLEGKYDHIGFTKPHFSSALLSSLWVSAYFSSGIPFR